LRWFSFWLSMLVFFLWDCCFVLFFFVATFILFYIKIVCIYFCLFQFAVLYLGFVMIGSCIWHRRDIGLFRWIISCFLFVLCILFSLL
jgi:hypothetical protein